MPQDFDHWSWTPDWLPETPPHSGWGLLAYVLVFVLLAWVAAPLWEQERTPTRVASASELATPFLTNNGMPPATCSCLPIDR